LVAVESVLVERVGEVWASEDLEVVDTLVHWAAFAHMALRLDRMEPQCDPEQTLRVACTAAAEFRYFVVAVAEIVVVTDIGGGVVR
jgi:hypothetical protein